MGWGKMKEFGEVGRGEGVGLLRCLRSRKGGLEDRGKRERGLVGRGEREREWRKEEVGKMRKSVGESGEVGRGGSGGLACFDVYVLERLGSS